MSSGSFKNVNYSFANCVDKQDLALNDLQGLIQQTETFDFYTLLTFNNFY